MVTAQTLAAAHSLGACPKTTDFLCCEGVLPRELSVAGETNKVGVDMASIVELPDQILMERVCCRLKCMPSVAFRLS
jgi:hypothetical protein